MVEALKKERSAYWDNIKGFLMLLVVFAHVLYQLQGSSSVIDSTVDYIYMFHMPAFVFVSGYFGRSERSRSFEGIIKLIFLYFIFNSIMGFIYGFSSLLVPMYSYWYLSALIVWRLTAHHIAGFREISLILFITALFIGFYPSVDNTLASSRIICFYPYYMAGYKLSEEKSAALSGRKYVRRASVGMMALTGAGVLAFGAYSYFRYTDAALAMYGYTHQTDAFGRLALYVIAFLVIYALRCLSPDRRLPLLTSFGRNSLWIFILHRPFTLLISSYLSGMSLPLVLIASVISAFGLCVLFGNDIIARLMNAFLSSGADIFLSKSKKFTLAKLAALAVALWFILSVLISVYSDVFH